MTQDEKKKRAQGHKSKKPKGPQNNSTKTESEHVAQEEISKRKLDDISDLSDTSPSSQPPPDKNACTQSGVTQPDQSDAQPADQPASHGTTEASAAMPMITSDANVPPVLAQLGLNSAQSSTNLHIPTNSASTSQPINTSGTCITSAAPTPQMTMSSQPQIAASMAPVITMGTTTIGSSTNTTNDLHPVFTQVANPFSAPSHNVPPMCLSPPPVCMQNPWELYQNYDHLGAAAPIYTMPAIYSTPLPPSTNYAGPQQDTSSSWLQLQGPPFVALFAMALRDPGIQELYNELGMTNKNCATKQELESCRAELELLKSSYCELKKEVEDLKQYTRSNALRISNPAWKDSNDEDTDERILNLCEEFKINANRGDISRSHRVGKKETNKIRPILVKFTGYRPREAVYKARRAIREKYPRIQIYEDLTKQTNELAYLARCHKRENILTDTCVNDGKVFVKSHAFSGPQIIHNKEHLSEVIAQTPAAPPTFSEITSLEVGGSSTRSMVGNARNTASLRTGRMRRPDDRGSQHHPPSQVNSCSQGTTVRPQNQQQPEYPQPPPEPQIIIEHERAATPNAETNSTPNGLDNSPSSHENIVHEDEDKR